MASATYLQPTNGARDVPQTKQQPVALREADRRRAELAAARVARVHAPQALGPEVDGGGRGRGPEAQAEHGLDPVGAGDEIGGWRGAAPFLEEGRDERGRVPGGRSVSIE